MAALQWRETMASDRLIPMDGWVLPSKSNTHTDGVGQALGLFARVDFQHNGLPFWSISGQQINNIRDVKNHYSFSLTDGATQAQELMAEQIGTITRGEVGVETAASGSGFQFLGVWNASTDPLKWFYNKRRGRDWTHIALMKSVRLRLGVENVTPGAVDAVLRDMQEIGAYLIQRKCVVGFKCDFVRSDNSPSELRQGRFVVTYAQEEPSPITRIGINSQLYFKALEVELNTLIAQAGTLVPQYLTNDPTTPRPFEGDFHHELYFCAARHELFAGDDGPDNKKALNIGSISLPIPEEKTSEIMAGGAKMGIEVGMGVYGALTLGFKLYGYDPQTMSLLGGNRVPWTTYGAIKDTLNNTGKLVEVRCTVWGRLTKLGIGELKRGELSEQDHEIKDIVRYELWWDKKPKYTLDIRTGEDTVDGAPRDPTSHQSCGSNGGFIPCLMKSRSLSVPPRAARRCRLPFR